MSDAVLARARGGDEQAFRELVDPHLRELRLHCYRIVGSLADAEDVLQETLFAAWRALATFQERASWRAWLYRIATNRSLNHLRDNGRRHRPSPVPPFPPPEPTRRGEIAWLDPYPDSLLDQVSAAEAGPEARYQAQEAVELAFVEALQHLPPRQAATLILRDVLGFPLAEVAEMLDTTPTAVKGALARARAALDERRSTVRHRPARTGRGERELSRRFAAAFVADDIHAVIALLTDDAWLAMPPAPHEYQGGTAIATFLRASAAWRGHRRFHLVRTGANTQPAFGCYLEAADATIASATGLIVLTTTGDRISTITRFLDPGLPQRFGLPYEVTTPRRGRPPRGG